MVHYAWRWTWGLRKSECWEILMKTLSPILITSPSPLMVCMPLVENYCFSKLCMTPYNAFYMLFQTEWTLSEYWYLTGKVISSFSSHLFRAYHPKAH